MSTVDQVSGTGLAFPILLDNGVPKLTVGWDLIKSCLWNILAFEYGQRYFQRDFGANLDNLLEEPNDQVSSAQLQHRLNEQISQWENRVALSNLGVTRNQGKLNITIEVTLRNSNPLQTETFDFTL